MTQSFVRPFNRTARQTGKEGAEPLARPRACLVRRTLRRLRNALRRLRWPLMLRRTYERDVHGLQELLEQERARLRALQWWQGGRQ